MHKMHPQLPHTSLDAYSLEFGITKYIALLLPKSKSWHDLWPCDALVSHVNHCIDKNSTTFNMLMRVLCTVSTCMFTWDSKNSSAWTKKLRNNQEKNFAVCNQLSKPEHYFCFSNWCSFCQNTWTMEILCVCLLGGFKVICCCEKWPNVECCIAVCSSFVWPTLDTQSMMNVYLSRSKLNYLWT